MLHRSRSFCLLILFCATAFSQQKRDTIRVFYLGGQSNMEGYGYTSELPKALTKKSGNVWIFHGSPAGDSDTKGGLGKWDVLQPGHGTDFTSDGKKNVLSNRFGVELSFAARLQELYPNQKIALIKYARNGSSIDSLAANVFGSWEADYKGKKGINQYDHFLKTVDAAMGVKDINGDGIEDILVPGGILWMQGESDADKTEEIAQRYYFNLKRLMDLMRAAFRKNDMPVIIGKISDSGDDVKGKVWQFGELVQYAEEKFARTDGRAAIVRTTAKYTYSDKYHYNSAGYIDLGTEFANALFQLNAVK